MSKTAATKTAKIAKIRQPPDHDEPLAIQPEVKPSPFPGHVDYFGYSSGAGGWLFSGWVPRPSRTDQAESVEFLAQYEGSQIKGRATLAFYPRADLDHKSIGVLAFVPGGSRAAGALQHVTFTLDFVKHLALSSHGTHQVEDKEVVDRVRSILIHHAFSDGTRDLLLAKTARRGFTGQDTLSALSETVLIEVDEAILCPPSAVLLKGWLIAAPGVIRSIRVRSGPLSGEMDLADSIVTSRPDVIAAVGQPLGFTDVRCGFISYVPSAIATGEVAYFEVELSSGEIGFKRLTISKRSGIDAIRRSLDGIQLRYAEIDPAFDNVLGPAILSLNAARLDATEPAVTIEFGATPRNSKYSIIIPLYGRVDFVEYQMALFSEHAGIRDMEILYVLDDPTKRRELEVLAESTFERFGIPFKLIMLPVNLGFGPANNAGLRAATGEYICFLNSDIFPITKDWMERLVERLEHNADIGVVGARLLFEDGSVQHEGCYYRTIAEFGNWTFVEHFNKGRRPDATHGLQRYELITGACMVLRRSLAIRLDGFDERYIVGDFEDSDICRRVAALGLSSAVDYDVELYHLERKSQVGPSQSWRMNLTLYNAWIHQRQWFDVSTPVSALAMRS